MKIEAIREVRKKYPNAYSRSVKHFDKTNDKKYSILTGEDKKDDKSRWRPKGSIPAGWIIGQGKSLREAWDNALL